MQKIVNPGGRHAACWLPGMTRLSASIVLSLVLLAGAARGADAPIPVKVVIVTTFETDYNNPKGTGASNGEASRWIERLHMDRVFPLAAGFRPVHMNADGVMEIMTGMATARAAATTMAVGLDPRFDLSKAYWLLAGTAGIDPERASQGSAAWAEWIVDGDLTNYIDPREIPKDWPDGRIPWDKTSPFDQPGANIGQVYHVDPGLVHWAYGLTKDTVIPDTAPMKEFRAKFTGFPEAQKPPFVLIGDTLTSATYWQGTLATEWARRWVKLYTHGAGTFVTSACEETGFLQSMSFLANAGKVDLKRVLVLRAASDYCVPRPGVTSAESLQYGSTNAYMAENEAFESLYAVGDVVVREWVSGWATYGGHVPGTTP
jgi:purine nucleoside permease